MGIRKGDYLVGVGDKDVKRNTKDEVVTKIMEAKNYLRVTFVTPIKAWQKPKSSESKSECDSYSLVGSSSMTSLSNVTKLFPSSGSSSRTSFSSISSTTSETSSSSGSEKLENKRKKSWSVLKIIDH